MKDLKELTVTQIRIFPADYIPYSYLLRREFIDYVCSKYNFQHHEIPFEKIPGDVPRVMIFSSGEYKIDKKKVIIKRLSFENRRILTEITCPSKTAVLIFNTIARDIRKFDMDEQFKASSIDFFSEETSCIVTLNIDFMKVYSTKFKSFLSKDFLNILPHKYFEIYPKSFRFEVGFETEEKLMKKRISLAPKQLVIEPRTERPIDDQVFFTSSPCDTNTHLEILKSFEKTFREKVNSR